MKNRAKNKGTPKKKYRFKITLFISTDLAPKLFFFNSEKPVEVFLRMNGLLDLAQYASIALERGEHTVRHYYGPGSAVATVVDRHGGEYLYTLVPKGPIEYPAGSPGAMLYGTRLP